ncbi:hypothetical protein CR513_16106, partial [Mucuna pruriens]
MKVCRYLQFCYCISISIKCIPTIQKEKLKSDAKYYIWDDPYLWRLCNEQVIRRCILDSEINSHLATTTMDKLGQPSKCLIVGFIDPPFSKTLINSSPPTSNVRKQEWP